MFYICFFSDGGTPKTGLSPSIDIYKKISDGSSAGTAPSVTELSGGFYKFELEPEEDLVIRVNSNDASMADADRYVVFTASEHDDNLNLLPSMAASVYTMVAPLFVKDETLYSKFLKLFGTDVEGLTGDLRSLADRALTYSQTSYAEKRVVRKRKIRRECPWL